MSRLGRSFYARPTLEVAAELIGKYLVHEVAGRTLAGCIVETEAYIGEEDQASHARFGRTARSALMYGDPGMAYVFLIYGMHHCFNVVCERKEFPAAVLVRALELEENAGSGPGRLCRALEISRSHNGLDVTSPPLWIEARDQQAVEIVTTPRIGVEYAGAWAKKSWRFVDAKSRSLSHRLSQTR